MLMEGPETKRRQQESNVAIKPCQTVVLYTVEQVTYVQQYLHLLRIERIEADLVQCADKVHFIRIDFTRYSRIDLLVDETMCGLLMVNDELHIDVHRTFEEKDSSDKTIYVSNKMSTRDELFDHLYSRLPMKTRKLFKGCQSQDLLHGKVNTYYQTDTHETTKKESEFAFRKGRTTTEYDAAICLLPIIIVLIIMFISGLLITGGRAPNMVIYTIQCSQERQNEIILTIEGNKHQLNVHGPENVEITTGSVIITLTMKEGFVVTDEWIQGVLRTIFDDILGSSIAEGETFTVEVGRYITNPGMTDGSVTMGSEMTGGRATTSIGSTDSSASTSSGMRDGSLTTSTGMTGGALTTSTGMTGGTLTTSTGMTGGTLTTSTGMTGGSVTSSNVTGSVGGNDHANTWVSEGTATGLTGETTLTNTRMMDTIVQHDPQPPPRSQKRAQEETKPYGSPPKYDKKV